MNDLIGRMPTGIPGLDQLLEGGIVRGNSLLIEGAPGSGKTTFGVRMVAEGVRQYGEPGLIISFEEFPRQIYEEAKAHGIDLEALEATGKLRVIWTPPQRILDSFSGRNDLVDSLIQEMGVRRVLIDSVTHFRRVSNDEASLREVLANVLNYLKIHGVNSLLVKELERQDERDIAFEEYLVDASLRVHNAPRSNGGENIRLVEIRKTRGQGHTSGRHPFLLSDEGLQVFPRLRPQDVRFGLADLHHPERTRVSTGVAGLDEMLGGGIWENSVNAVSGYQGTGKSVLAYHFLDRQLAAGGKALYVSFYRSPGQIIADVGSLHMDWVPAHEEGRLHLMRADWVGVTPEVFLNRLFRKVAELGPDAVVIDSLNDFIGLCDDGRRVRDDILVLAEMLRSVGATAMLLQRLTVMRGDSANADESYGELMDAHLQLTMAESDGQLQRFVSIRKHSGSSHVSELREVEIDSAGMHVASKATSKSGVMTGDARRGYEDPAEEILPRIEHILGVFRGVLENLPDDDEMGERLSEARSELAIADAVLREHFGVTEYYRLAESRPERD
jgi:circadian clock protein KaiC